MKTPRPFPRLWHCVTLVTIACALLTACGKDNDHPHEDDHEEAGHTHDARHGGVAVALGDEEFHVEFTHGGEPGILQAYIFDGHMENYIRTAMPTFPATVQTGDRSMPVVFSAVADPATGETVGDTALFEATVAGLGSQPALVLQVPELVVRGITYTSITAEVPVGKSF